MPELPEVETVRRILATDLLNKEISSVEVYRPKNIVTGADDFISSLAGKRFVAIERKGKILIFRLSSSISFLSHLRMEGKWRVTTDPNPIKHDILAIRLTDGQTLFYNDVRKFGVIYLKKDEELFVTPPLSALGEDPFSLDPQHFHEGLKKHGKLPIKESLLDQTLVAGIGNIYDIETLFACHIHPLTPSGEITLEEAESILKESSRIMGEAIENGGSTIKSFHPKEGYSGLMQNKLLIYGKENDPCPVCGTPLRRITVGGRGTSYCPHCQRRKNYPLVIGVTGPIASGKSALSSLLKKRGFDLFDADKAVSEIYSNPSFIEKLPRKFRVFFGKDGLKDRDGLRDEVASNAESKKELEALVHPEVYALARKAIESTKKKGIVLDIPLLLDGPMENACDFIFVVNAPIEVRQERLVKRGKPVNESIKINDSFSLTKAKKKATHIFDGGGSLDNLKNELDSLAYLDILS